MCRELHDASYCRKCKTLLYLSDAYITDWSDDEFKSTETCSNSYFFYLLCITSLYYVDNKKIPDMTLVQMYTDSLLPYNEHICTV